MTKKQLRDRVIQEIGLQDIEDYNESTLIDDLIYQGTIDLLARTRCSVRCVHLKTKKDEAEYILDKSILALVEVEEGHLRRKRRDENGDSEYWPAVVVYPAGYVRPRHRGFTLVRSDVLLLDPAPAEDGEIDVWAVIRPSRMVADTDSPSTDMYGGIPEEYHEAIFLYAAWQAASYADDDSANQGERYRFRYEGQDGNGGKLQEIKKLVNKRGTARAPRRRVRVRSVRNNRSFIG